VSRRKNRRREESVDESIVREIDASGFIKELYEKEEESRRLTIRT